MTGLKEEYKKDFIKLSREIAVQLLEKMRLAGAPTDKKKQN